MAKSKRIIAFSDGTGNSSGKLFQTNVFRLYNALQLGDITMPRPQIAYYDNGVGTSSIRLFAVLGGVFGFGLKRNLFELYCYICRNYNPGDEIHAFGFSRGAFTIRLLVGLICEQGIAPYEDERELKRNCADALRRFLGHNAPDVFPLLFRLVRGARDGIIRGWRGLFDQAFNAPAQHRPDVEFVGVWDTVAAYGGPISEVTRGIDQYVWPLTMTDYMLHPKVRRARHALALDDERDSFWPLLWDEVAESRRLGRASEAEREADRADPRIKQVWFAGVHSDVGGGYPDDSLAYVSLRWMIAEIGERLAFIDDECDRIEQFANPLGPLHDSRAGLAAYYRYQPRKISAMLHRLAPDVLTFEETLVLRDPIIGEQPHRPEGLLQRCLIHRSVIERIAVGNDNYAPIVLPRDFTVDDREPPSADEVLQALALLADPAVADARAQDQENAWDLVWLRRVAYFGVVAVTILLAAAPLRDGGVLFGGTPQAFVLGWISGVLGWLGNFVPALAQPWYKPLAANWPDTLIWIALLVALAFLMTSLEARLSDRVRIGWWTAIAGAPLAQSPPGASTRLPPTRLRRIRNSRPYQRALQVWKWRILPAVTGFGILLGGLYLIAIIAVQGSLYVRETKGSFCNSELPVGQPTILRANQPCLRLQYPSAGGNALVHQGLTYFVEIEAPPDRTPLNDAAPPAPAGIWSDGSLQGIPAIGLRTLKVPWRQFGLMMLATGARRVATARWLEPIIELREPGLRHKGFAFGKATIQRVEFLKESSCAPAAPQPGQPDTRRKVIGTFQAARDGDAYLFLNDVALPRLPPAYFYDGTATTRNGGAATVRFYDAKSFAEHEIKCRRAGQG